MKSSELLVGGGILWEKEKPWKRVPGPAEHKDGDDSVMYYDHRMFLELPFKTIEFKVSKTMINRYGGVDIGFVACTDKNFNTVNYTKTYDNNNGIVRIEYENYLAKVDALSVDFKQKIYGISESQIKNMIDLQYRIIE